MRKILKKAQRGFSILELSLVLFIGAGLLTTMVVVLQQFRQNQSYETYSALQAREMALVKEAAKKYVQTQQATMTLGQRLEYDVPTLITQGFLPTDFALRDPGTGPQAGISPFGQPYNVVSIKDAVDKKVRTVIYDNGVPSPARLARAGVARVAASILSLKANIAGRGVSEQKTITGTVAAGALGANGYLNTFANFDVAPWILSAPTQAMTMVFVGFPELGGDTDQTNPGGPRFTNCQVISASGGCGNSGDPNRCRSGENNDFEQTTCPVGKVEVKRFPLCAAPLTIVDTPVGSLTTGIETVITPNRAPEFLCSDGVGGVINWGYVDTVNGGIARRQLPDSVNTYQRTSLNNVVVLSDDCEQRFAYAFNNVCPGVAQTGWINVLGRPNAPQNLVCCEEISQ